MATGTSGGFQSSEALRKILREKQAKKLAGKKFVINKLCYSIILLGMTLEQLYSAKVQKYQINLNG